MNPFIIENAKQRFFNSKDEYLSFRKAWKDFHSLQPLVTIEQIDVTPWQLRKPTNDRIYAKVKVSVLGPEHYMLYNLLRGKDVAHGFKPLTRKGRLEACKSYYGVRPWHACEETVRNLAEFAHLEDRIGKDASFSKWQIERFEKKLENILKPFGNTVSRETVVTIGKLLQAYLKGNKPAEVAIPVTPQEVLTITDVTVADKEVQKGFLARVLGW